MSIMPATRRRTTTDPDLTAVVLVLALTEPDLHSPALPGETANELAAREAAAADITDDILFELGSAA